MLRFIPPILALSVLLVPTVALAQEGSDSPPALLLGKVTTGSSDSDNPTVYLFEAEGPGLLVVAIRGQGDTDFRIVITDDIGQSLPDGRSDHDIGGARGAEQIFLTIPHAGTYHVTISIYGGGKGIYAIGASWLGFPMIGGEPDADGKPDGATALEIGKKINDSIDSSSGDIRDWFSIRLEEAGTLTLLTRAEEGDLVLEYFKEGEYGESTERSDQDLQEKPGNESISVQGTAGQVFRFRVTHAYGAGSVEYSVTSGFIPE